MNIVALVWFPPLLLRYRKVKFGNQTNSDIGFDSVAHNNNWSIPKFNNLNIKGLKINENNYMVTSYPILKLKERKKNYLKEMY